MARRWTPSTWSRAKSNSIKSRTKVKAELKNNRAELTATEFEYLNGEKEYEISLFDWDVRENSFYKAFKNKDEANRCWIATKRKYF